MINLVPISAFPVDVDPFVESYLEAIEPDYEDNNKLVMVRTARAGNVAISQGRVFTTDMITSVLQR